MKVTDELRQIVALTLVKNVGPVTFKKLIEIFGTVPAIFKARSKELAMVKGISRVNVPELMDKRLMTRADLEIKKALEAKADIITYFDARYPEVLKEIFDPPILLYVKGRLPEKGYLGIAVVGSRVASLYGQKMAVTISRELAQAGIVVVSGLATGIDGAAHEGCLEGGGVTVAVLGGGISKLYPPENKKLAERIVEKGAVISEYPMDMFPMPEHFPVRNRIISGLSRGVVVVEAKKKSGALITVDAALEQGREVFAVPGPADSLRSQGTNHLLRQGAKLATGVEDILEELKIKPAKKHEAQTRAKSLGEDETTLLSLLDGQSLHVDTLIEKSGIPTSRAIAALSLLEIKKWVKQLPGKNFIKI